MAKKVQPASWVLPLERSEVDVSVVMSRALLRQAHRRVALGRRSLSDGYYDSQSGVFVSTTAALRLIEHSARGPIEGLECVAPASEDVAGRIARVAAADDVAKATGASAVRYDGSIGDRSTALAVAKAAANAGLPADFGFSDASADIDHVLAELVVGELADAGGRAFLFTVGKDDVDDDDDVRELWDAIGAVDVVGTPMKKRLGLMTSEVDARDLVSLADSLGSNIFDVCARGHGRTATRDLLDALGERHNVDVGALEMELSYNPNETSAS